MKKKKYLIIILGVFIYIFIAIGQTRVPIEELNIITAITYDIRKKGKDMIEYISAMSTKVYHSNGKQNNLVLQEKGKSIGDITQKGQLKNNKKFSQGQEKIILIGETYAVNGIKALMEDRFRKSEINDMAFVAVCKGNPGDYLKEKVKGYNSAAEFIDGLIENSKDYGFFSENYKLIDMYVRIGAEGKSLTLPYIEKTEESIEIKGLAVFKGDKMIEKLNMNKAKILNFLKESNVRGVMSIEKDYKHYIDVDIKTGKRKVKCSKNGEKYRFDIDITSLGTVVSNELYEEIVRDVKSKKEFEKVMGKNIEEQCYDFLKIMQKQYRKDFIELGKEAAAKFGRHKGIDWDEVVSNADIKVNVKVKVDTQGRGDY